MSTKHVTYGLLGLLFLTACQTDLEYHAPNAPQQLSIDNLQRQERAAQTLFDNGYISVQRIDLRPDEAYSFVATGPGVLYPLSNCQLAWLEDKTKAGQLELEPEHIHFHVQGQYRIHNIALKGCHFLLFAYQQKAESDCAPLAALEHSENSFAEELFENQHFQIRKFRLEPGIEITEQGAQNRLVYALSNYRLRNTEGFERKLQNGELYWINHCSSSIRNSGHTRAQWLQVRLK